MRPWHLFAGFVSLAVLAGGALTPSGTLAQTVAQQIFTLDQDRFFINSAFGQRVQQEVKARSEALGTENRRLEDELKAEEQALTEQRPTLDPAAFRTLADAFDKKVEATRAGQAKKASDLNAWAESERQRYFKLAFPELVKLFKETGAVAILDQRAAIIFSEQMDLTARAITRIDAVIGDGADAPVQ
ncbi:MAG: OmpH family outer membrane protein [Paracoccaceae bacterium]